MIWIAFGIMALAFVGFAYWLVWKALPKMDKFYTEALNATDVAWKIRHELIKKSMAHSIAAVRDDISEALGEYRAHGHETGSNTPPQARE